MGQEESEGLIISCFAAADHEDLKSSAMFRALNLKRARAS